MPRQLQEYHTGLNRQSWRGTTGPREVARLRNRRMVGIEFETETSSPEERGLLIDELDAINEPLKTKFIVESDGSLDSYRGLEVILPPLAYRSFFGAKSIAKKVVGAVKRIGADMSKDQVGLHVNLNVAGCSVQHIGAAVASFHQMKPVCQSLAGRREGHYWNYRGAVSISDYVTKLNKYAAAWYRGAMPVIEVRLFRSNPEWDVTRDQVRFAIGVLDFAAAKTNEIRDLVAEHGIKNTRVDPYNGISYFIQDRSVENIPLIREFSEWLKTQKSRTLRSVINRIKPVIESVLTDDRSLSGTTPPPVEMPVLPLRDVVVYWDTTGAAIGTNGYQEALRRARESNMSYEQFSNLFTMAGS